MSLHCLKLLMAPCCFYIKVQAFIMIFNTLFLWFLPSSLASPFPPKVLCSIHTKLFVVPLMHPLFPTVTLLASSGSLRSSHAPLLLLLPHSSSFPSSANFYLPYNLQLWFHFICKSLFAPVPCKSDLGALPISFLGTITFSFSEVWQPIL